MKKAAIVVRPMKISEAIPVATLLRKVIKDLKYYNPIARQYEIGKYTPSKLRKKIKNDKFSVLVAYIDSALVGFCFSRWDDFTIWTEWFGVDLNARGKGVAKSLLAKLEKTVKNRKAHKIWCDCRTTNLISKNILTRSGYKIIAMIPKHWYKQDFILWHKQIY